MVFYIIEALSQPEMLFACCTINDVDERSRNIVDHREGVIEFSYDENLNGDMLIETEHGTYRCPEGAIAIHMPDCRYVCTPPTAAKVSMSSVAVRLPYLRFKRYENDDLQQIWRLLQERPTALAFPEVVTESLHAATGDETKLLQAKMRFIISAYRDNNAFGIYSCISQWYELCAEINRHFRKMIGNNVEASKDQTHHVSGAHYYVYKAKKYITSHADKKIEPEDVSANVKLSHEYFLKLFKREMGISLNDYIYHERIHHLRIMIDRNSEQSFKSLAAECGFSDIRHAQRLFQKYIGMSMQEYRKQVNGLTLFHTNPWEYKDLDEDLLKKDKL